MRCGSVFRMHSNAPATCCLPVGHDGAHCAGVIAWRVSSQYPRTVVDDEGQVAVCRSEVNARLIAAAPELLEACNEALFALIHTEMVEESEGREGPAKRACEAIRAAIAKAGDGR